MSPALVTCAKCRRILERGAVCPACGPTRAQAPGAFSSQHRRARAALLADLAMNPGQLCGFCSQPMYSHQELDADHGRGHREYASRLLHARCNRQRGAG